MDRMEMNAVAPLPKL